MPLIEQVAVFAAAEKLANAEPMRLACRCVQLLLLHGAFCAVMLMFLPVLQLPIKESSLRRPGATSTAAAGGAEDATSEAGPPQRRLEVRVEEFCQSSEFCDSIVATTLLKVPADWLASGLLIHPCMRLPGERAVVLHPFYSCVSQLLCA